MAQSRGYEEPTESWDLSVDDRGRRLSEDTLLRTSDYESSPERGDKVNESSGFLDYITSSTSSIPKFGTLPRIRHFLTKFFLFLIPSFISPYITGVHPPAEKLYPTAWLDGLRGIACVVVVIHHYAYGYSRDLEHPYDGRYNTMILQLPIIKLIHHGLPMVKIFYIISGFVLTVKAVKLTRVSGAIDAQALISNLSTSVWKRYLRLYIPCAISFVLCAFIVSLGLFEAVPYGTHPKWVSGLVERRPPSEGNIFNQLWWAIKDFYIFGIEVTFFDMSNTKYHTDTHLWTIPVEFRNSISLFIVVAGGCLLKRGLRVYLCLPFLTTALLYNRYWGLALFVFGYFLAELHSDILAAAATPLPTAAVEKPSTKKSILTTLLHVSMILVGMYLASYPRGMKKTKETTGFQFLIALTPRKYPLGGGKTYDHTNDFWQCVGSMMIVWALLYMPRIQKAILCNKVVQYFGKISFALYIMHGHIHRSVGYWVVVNGLKCAGIWHWDGGRGEWVVQGGRDSVYNAIIVGGFFLITFPMTVCWADVFWRAADLQSVRFLRWLETKIKRSG
ncbi:hypothetical protein TWF694_011516 [Orbilia ellipsospora]|uniref:Acyltransferase 3 domain-containing protein n=1 Tax=Orbilia ellipsospora TaxID=2528407 RepID=A0AAV9X6Q2_9PEZI